MILKQIKLDKSCNILQENNKLKFTFNLEMSAYL